MIRVHIVETIHRPVEEVFEQLTDISNWPTWMSKNGIFITCRQESDGPVAQGTTYMDITKMGKIKGEVSEMEKPRKVVFHYWARLFGSKMMEGWPGYELQKLGPQKTKVIHHAEGRLFGWFKLFKPLVQKIANKERRLTLQSLKRSLE